MPESSVTLAWPGKARLFVDDEATPRASPPEVAHTRCGRGLYLFGDNARALSELARTHAGRIALAYLDPPFLTNRVHDAVTRSRGAGGKIVRASRAAFDDRWEDRGAFLASLGRRIALARELLAPHGSLVVHVDPKTSHYVKVLMDEIFGEDCFASEIIWRYRRWPAKTANYQRVHDVLLRYRKDPAARPRWNQAYEPLAASTLATWGTKKQNAVFDGGRRARSSSLATESLGVPMGDVWEIGVLAPVSRERTGYPSQKPEALLSRLIETLSDPGDLVLDPYAGSGTTLAAAARLGRGFVGIDQSEVARDTTRARLAAMGLALEAREAPAKSA